MELGVFSQRAPPTTTMPLSDTAIKKAKPEPKPYKLADSGGLFLLVSPSGGKSWRWKYRIDGKEKAMGFGTYPDVSLAQAREFRDQARKQKAVGVDPMAERKLERLTRRVSAENSFSSVSQAWLAHWGQGKSPRHVDYVRRRIEQDVTPVLGGRPINDIKAIEIVSMVKAISNRGALDIAKRAFQTCGQIFRYAVAHGLAERNPASDILPSDILPTRQKEHYARVGGSELPNLLRQMEAYPGAVSTRIALKLLAHTFVRTSELIGARWSEFDLRGRTWRIPAGRMKMKTEHIVPLSDQVLEHLRTLHVVTGHSELLFPGERDHAKPMSNNTILAALKRMGYQGRMTGHGFRGVASTLLHEQGHEHAHIELQLAHMERNTVSAAYNHALYLEPRAKMMQRWSDFLDAQLKGPQNPEAQTAPGEA